MKANVGNEKVKGSYFRWLREVKGFAEASIVAVERVLSRWGSAGREDFGRSAAGKVIAFKEYR
jgi:hypothetical protein